MFSKLRNRIIIITMTITTIVLIAAGFFIVFFSSNMRPEPKPQPESEYSIPGSVAYDDQELKDFIKIDREEGNARLLVTLFCVGAIIEVSVFFIIYNLSQKIVKPVKESYDNQKLFIANASHGLKTPLAVIEANMEAMDVDKNNEKWKNNIENEITQANKLVLDLLSLAKMDAGSFDKAKVEEVDLTKELEKDIELFRPKFSGKVLLETSRASKTYILPKQDFFQIFNILLDNATKYGDQKIFVVLNKNSITIINDGATIPEDEINKIFDRFYQTDKTKPGSGLGLAIAKAICEQNKWKISCENNKTTTKFTVNF